MKFFICLLFPLFIAVNGMRCAAQSIQISPENIDDNGLDYAKVIGQDESGIYLLMSNLSLESGRDRFGLKTRKYELSFYTYDLQRKWKKDPVPDPSSGTLENIAFFNNTTVIITSEQIRANNTCNLYIEVINAKGESIVKGRKVYTGNINKVADLAKPKGLISPDKRSLGIAMEESRNGEIIIHYCSIDENYQPLRQLQTKVSYSDKDAALSEFAISNQQDLFFLCFRKEIVNEEKSKLRRFSLFMVSNTDGRMNEYPFNAMDQQMTEAALVIDKINNQAIVTGFYADKTSFAGASLLYGTLSVIRPEKLEVKIGRLTNDAQLKFVGQRNTGGGVSLFKYPIQRVIPRSDGGSLVIAEAAYLSEYSFYDYFTQTFNRRVEFHYDNILALSVNANGTIHWSQLIQKDQTSMDDEGLYSSCNIVLSPEELIVIFNKDIGRNNEIVGHAINARGQLTIRTFSKKSDSISILPRAGKQVDENTIIVPAVTKKRLFLVKIEL
ncbi:MAG: hypothetical protein IPJ86_02475 [Bacteroidetes bacterium]|nr:hypothetical protein [Bacteroidota bacterium]